jgi:hypothetical protein
MLEHEFFPTPEGVAIKMLSPFFGKCKWSKYEQILDPSAGKGSLLKALLKEEYRLNQMYAIKIDPDLRYILNNKGYRVIGTDFLEYDEPMMFNLIVMNPPFSKGIDHVLHAWELLDGDLVALLNAENLRNPYSEKRKILLHKLGSMIGETYDEFAPLEEFLSELEAAGQIEWLGQCFQNAEVKTNVDVVMVRLHRTREKNMMGREYSRKNLSLTFLESRFSRQELST